MRQLLRPIRTVFHTLARALQALLGEISWRPPGWLRRGWSTTTSACRQHPRSTVALMIALAVLTAASGWTWRWYQQQPKPHRVIATLVPVPVTPLEKTLTFPLLRITFSESAARLEDLRQPALRRVQLSPALPGNWRWMNDRELAFQPTEDWPADRTFRVTFEKSFFPRHVLVDRYEHEFKTPAFSAVIASCELAEDAKEPDVQRIIAKVQLTHSIATGELERHVTLAVIGGSQVFAGNDHPPHYSIIYGLHNREAWIRTAPLSLPSKEDWLRITLSEGIRTAQGGATISGPVEGKALIPGRDTAFTIKSAQADIVRNKEGDPEQVLHIETRGEISTAELSKAVTVMLLPKKASDEKEPEDASEVESAADEESEEGEEETHEQIVRWESAAEITEELLAEARPVAFTALPFGPEAGARSSFPFPGRSRGRIVCPRGPRCPRGERLRANGGLHASRPRPRAAARDRDPGRRGRPRAQRRTQTRDPLPWRALDQIRDRPRAGRPDQPSRQPD